MLTDVYLTKKTTTPSGDVYVFVSQLKWGIHNEFELCRGTKRLDNPDLKLIVFARGFLPGDQKIMSFIIEDDKPQMVVAEYVGGFFDDGYRVKQYHRKIPPKYKPLIQEIREYIAAKL